MNQFRLHTWGSRRYIVCVCGEWVDVQAGETRVRCPYCHRRWQVMLEPIEGGDVDQDEHRQREPF